MPQYVAENMKDFPKNGHLAIPYCNLKITGFIFSTVLMILIQILSLSIPVLFCHSPLLENIASGHEKVCFHKIPRSYCLRKHYTAVLKMFRLSNEETKYFTKKGVGVDFIWNIKSLCCHSCPSCALPKVLFCLQLYHYTYPRSTVLKTLLITFLRKL